MGFETPDNLKLYIRLPVKIKEELQIKELHPSIKAVQLPRQKSRRWCFIHFEDSKTLEDFCTDLKEKTINGKRIVIKPYTRGGIQNKKSKNSGVSVIPPTELLLKKEQN